LRCQEARARDLAWEEPVVEVQWAATVPVRDQVEIVSARIVVKRLRISREFPVIRSNAQNAEQK
jgi:hypothetical protein